MLVGRRSQLANRTVSPLSMRLPPQMHGGACNIMTSDGGPRVEISSLVRVRWSDEPVEDQFIIVPDDESDLKRSRVSALAPFARAVMGHSAGERVVINGVGRACGVTIVAVVSPTGPDGRVDEQPGGRWPVTMLAFASVGTPR